MSKIVEKKDYIKPGIRSVECKLVWFVMESLDDSESVEQPPPPAKGTTGWDDGTADYQEGDDFGW